MPPSKRDDDDEEYEPVAHCARTFRRNNAVVGWPLFSATQEPTATGRLVGMEV